MNTYSIGTETDYAEFYVIRRSGEIISFLVDLDDIERVKVSRWFCCGGRYIKNTKLGFLHHFIFGKKDGYMIDHINGNIYDNRKSNLRYADHRQNQLNTKSKGYYFNKKSKKWLAGIRIRKGVTKHLGTYETMELAREARHNAEKKYYGEFSNNV